MYLWQNRMIIGVEEEEEEELLGLSSWICILGREGGRGCLCRCGGHAFGRCRQICHRASFSSIRRRGRMERENKRRMLAMV